MISARFTYDGGHFSGRYVSFSIYGKHTNLRRQTRVGHAAGGGALRKTEANTIEETLWGEHFDCFVRLEPGMGV